jgi:HD-GYP domain-containing protein (c-di-GMP phosphodiesterase class II)
MTLKLARIMGIDPTDLLTIRRGALLHDIGKMGVPDAILLKPGKLTAEEWEIMRKHPLFAYKMLWPIEYLRPSIDIPYCHHEHWDGSGYPRGLKDEEIPLVARIFCIADVWDAMRSDRPYRAALSEDQVCEYILSASGSHFDPQVVDAFFDLLAEQSRPE